MSNGTEELVFLDPVTLARQYSLRVQDMSGPVRPLNELEFIKGEIFANIWQDDSIAIISPKTGKVTGWVDLSALRKELPPGGTPGPLTALLSMRKKAGYSSRANFGRFSLKLKSTTKILLCPV